jgi:DeoR/GlpR family transcriptional regulator of sugar metabolism
MNLNQRMTANQSEKNIIAQKIAGMIENNDTVMLNAGTTTLLVFRMLPRNLNLSITPELTFVEDTSIAYGAKIEKIISGFTYAEHPEEETTEKNAFDELLDEEDDE